MVLPLYLAMTAAEMHAADTLPENFSWMACHFSPYCQGLSNLPQTLPQGALLILNDRFPCDGHCPGLIAQQLKEIVEQFECSSVLLDFQRPGEAETESIVTSIVEALPCPVAVSNCYAAELGCPVFLPPAPLHQPLEEYLKPWQGREIWLEAALCQEAVTVTPLGTGFVPQFPTDKLEGGFYEDNLKCRYLTEIHEDEVRFTLFDTRESLEHKLELAASLGVKCAVGLYQELGKPAPAL